MPAPYPLAARSRHRRAGPYRGGRSQREARRRAVRRYGRRLPSHPASLEWRLRGGRQYRGGGGRSTLHSRAQRRCVVFGKLSRGGARLTENTDKDRRCGAGSSIARGKAAIRRASLLQPRGHRRASSAVREAAQSDARRSTSHANAMGPRASFRGRMGARRRISRSAQRLCRPGRHGRRLLPLHGGCRLRPATGESRLSDRRSARRPADP